MVDSAYKISKLWSSGKTSSSSVLFLRVAVKLKLVFVIVGTFPPTAPSAPSMNPGNFHLKFCTPGRLHIKVTYPLCKIGLLQCSVH